MIAGICSIKYAYPSEISNFPFLDFMTEDEAKLKASNYNWNWKPFSLKGKVPEVKFVSKANYYEINFAFSADNVPSALNNKRVLILLETKSGQNYLIGLKNSPVILRVGMSIKEAGAAFSSNVVEVIQKQVFYPALWVV